MRHPASLVLTLLALLWTLAPAPPAAASNPGATQHGGRATAQVGAFVARADDAAAVRYNPAGVVRLDGVQLLAGLDFSNATDDADTSQGTFSANHTIQFPPAIYLTWKPDERGDLAFGLGLDAPYWYSVDWDPALFPGRLITREARLRLFEIHPTVSWALDENWSVGGGVRYLFGSFDQGWNRLGIGSNAAAGLAAATAPGTAAGPVDSTSAPATVILYEAELTAEADVSEITFDVGVQYTTNVWGWGAVYRHGAEIDEGGSLEAVIRDVRDPSRVDAIDLETRYERLATRQTFDLPSEVVVGAWVAPYPELRLELDLAWTRWSELDDTLIRVGNPGSPGASPLAELRVAPRDWDDVLAARLGIEGELTEEWTLQGGLAWEPSPVPSATVEPGFPRGDALVYAVGFSYDLPTVTFDVGYSFWSHDDLDPDLTSPSGDLDGFAADQQVWSASARVRF